MANETRSYWAQRKDKRVGPFPTRDEAVTAFRTTYPFHGEEYEATAKRHAIMTGWGIYGLDFSIEWHSAR